MEVTFELSDQVVGIVLEEKVDSSKLDQLRTIIKERIERYSGVSVYLEDRFDNGITLKAFMKDLFLEFREQDPVKKIAVVTDSKWFQIVSDFKNKFINTQVQSFDRKDSMKAMNWVME